MMYEVWSMGHKPFEELTGRQVAINLQLFSKFNCNVQYVEKITAGHRLSPPPGCPRALYEVMIQCW